MSSHLPDGTRLAYGTATAAYQVEGSTTADGRGPSIWDTFTARPGTIKDRSDGSVACASYLRLDDDLELLAGLGVDFYRFSVAWPRVQPTGSGAIEPRGLAYYDRLVDGLLARGVQPMATLYHWDLPQPLEDAGGWPERDDRRAVRRLRRDRARPPRRPGADLGDAQRAVVCRLPRATPPACTRRASASPSPRTAPPTTCCSATGWPRPGCTRPVPTPWASCST